MDGWMDGWMDGDIELGEHIIWMVIYLLHEKKEQRENAW